MRPDADVPFRPGDVLWIRMVLGLYVPLALASAAWIAWWHGPDVLLGRLLGATPGGGLVLGLGLGGALVLGTRFASRLGVLRGLDDTLQEHIGPLRPATCVILAVGSAVGEELAFRAVLQPAIGWLPATLAFAVVHAPVDRGLLWWPVFAFVAGGLFGLAYEATGGILAPAVAHFVVNALNLLWLSRRAARVDAFRRGAV